MNTTTSQDAERESSTYASIHRFQHEQMLKLVTESFYKELKRYGVANSGIVSISTHLLDYVTNADSGDDASVNLLEADYCLDDITRDVEGSGVLSLGEMRLTPLNKTHLPRLVKWLSQPEIRNEVISLPSLETETIRQHFLDCNDAQHFIIEYGNFGPIGLIGAENIEIIARKLEMKKFIGEAQFRGRGLGKQATLMFLYYVFQVLTFNKVYIHAVDTNIRNINLNMGFGFGLEGVAYEEVFIQGKFRDVVRMGLLRSRWQSLISAQRPEEEDSKLNAGSHNLAEANSSQLKGRDVNKNIRDLKTGTG